MNFGNDVGSLQNIVAMELRYQNIMNFIRRPQGNQADQVYQHRRDMRRLRELIHEEALQQNNQARCERINVDGDMLRSIHHSVLDEEGTTNRSEVRPHYDQERLQLHMKKQRKLQNLVKGNRNLFEDGDEGNFEMYDIKKDGNCLYRCLSKHLYNTEQNHKLVRSDIIEHMRNNKNLYAKYIDGDYEIHMFDQEKTDGSLVSWGTEAEIYAAATLYGVQIVVYNIQNKSTSKLNFESSDGEIKKTCVYLHLCHNHFNLLKPIKAQKISKQLISERTCQNKTTDENFDWFTTSDGNDESSDTTNKDSTKHNNESFEDHKHKTVESSNLSKLSQHSLKGKTNVKEKNVTNLSSKELSKDQVRLLERGFTFIPTRDQIDVTKLLSDLAEWERRMRLAEYFYDPDRDENNDDYKDEEKEWRKKKSDFTPKPGRDKWLDTYIDVVKDEIIQNLKKKINRNLTTQESTAMKELLEDDSIVIRPADKGSGIVVINREDYITNLEKEVMNDKAYQQTDGMMMEKAIKNVKKVTNKMYKDGVIDKDMKKYLVPKYTHAGKLKGNPKLHKTGNPYRTIVSGIGTPTEKMAGIMEKELDEFVQQSPSYIKDTTDFLNKLQTVDTSKLENPILFCFDVVKLYPSIPMKEGLSACKEALEARKHPEINTEGGLEMIKTILNNNVFQLHDMQFIQTDGIAIGSKLGKNFACAYMRKWDEKLMEADKVPMFYKRFIDDGFGIWTHGADELKKFQEHANCIHENIKVELRWSSTKIEFLDTLVSFKQGRLKTDLYVKPTDKHLYVDVKSCHPNSTKKAIPYGLGIRLKRICSEEKDYLKHKKDLKTQLRKRGYSSKFIEQQLDRVDKLDRKDLLLYKNKEKKQTTRIPLVITYSKQLPNIRHIVRKHQSILNKSDRLKNIPVFKNPPILAFKRDQNLGDILVHGKLNKIAKCHNGKMDLNKCDTECEVCDKLTKQEMVEVNGKTINQRDFFGCSTRNVIYAIFCKICDKFVYVGETERMAKERLQEHLNDIRLKRMQKSVAQHFNEGRHSRTDVEFVLLERCIPKSKYYRQIKELKWIEELRTEAPNGANIKATLGILWNEYHYQVNEQNKVGLYVAAEPLSADNYYFEVEIFDMGQIGAIGVGLVPRGYHLDAQPGWRSMSVGFHADDGKLFKSEGFGKPFGPVSQVGDRIGCGIKFSKDEEGDMPQQVKVFFTHNRKEVGIVMMMYPPGGFFPAVGMHSEGEEVKINLEAEWQYNELVLMAIDSGEEEWSRLHDVKLNGSLLEYNGRGKSIHDVGLAQARYPLDTTNHYFEIEIVDPGENCYIAIGLARRTYPKNRHPGWNKGSIAYHADDGKIFNGSGIGDHFGPRCNKGDIMGCGILFPPDYDSEADSDLSPDDPDVCNDYIADYENSDSDDDDFIDDEEGHGINGGLPKEDGTLVCVFFTCNGKIIGKKPVCIPKGGFYPTVGMLSNFEKVAVDFRPLTG